MRSKINYAGPSITEADADAVRDAVLNGFYSNYRLHVGQLEARVCEILGIQHALAVNSCTSALHLALAAAGIGPGDEVITTDASCVASALPIAFTGATAVLVDVEPSTWCLSPARVREAITPRTRALMPVHWNGHPAAMDELTAIAQEHHLAVVEDCAPSLGAIYRGRKVGTLGNVACFSFQGAKVAIAGQGGVLATNDSALYERAKVLASLGRTDSKMQYWSDFVGWNYGMPNLPAALAVSQLKRLEELLAFKRGMFAWYREGLAGCDVVRLVEPAPDTVSTCCYPPLELFTSASLTRDELLKRLREDNIDARPAQPRISGMPMFERRFETPVAESIEQRGIILPSAFNLTRDDVAFVCERIRALVL